jgi:hypothetical protein
MKIAKILIHYIVYCFVFSQRIKSLDTAFRFQPSLAWPTSFNRPAQFPKGQTAKDENGIISETTFSGTITVD